MWQMLRKRMGARDGFTLIELVVVVAILGILAVVVTPKVMGAIDNAKSSSQKSNAKQIQVAMERYYAEQGKYPETSLCSTDYNTTTFAGCTVTELKGALQSVLNLDTATVEDTIKSYQVVAASGTTPASYEITVTFKDGNADYEISADAITKK